MILRAALTCAVILIFLLMTGCTMWSDKPVRAWSSATGGEHLERLFWDTVKAKDWSDLERHVAPTFVYVGPTGIHEKLAALEYFEHLQITDLTLGDITVRPSGGDVVVVTYVAHINATRDGKPLSSNKYRMTSTWQKIDKNWLLISRAHTPATD
jgi:ketosteroid isomerase-like protein